ncbi:MULTISPECIES: hypothetical protein [Cyanophyceae]|uniref:hypothetical protein n=1 Tax=Cyanophyceae TaxID=3028117 RepID=UPI0016839546|nr:hypothetical protein [Trichocoleus sp. FACHB-40]MBD2002721.1 hypothetical protein [Trichocoleus sp. FACHB-40]
MVNPVVGVTRAPFWHPESCKKAARQWCEIVQQREWLLPPGLMQLANPNITCGDAA